MDLELIENKICVGFTKNVKNVKVKILYKIIKKYI